MGRIPIVLDRRRRRRLLCVARRCKDGALRIRYLIVVRWAERWSKQRIADALGCSTSTVGRVRQRWREFGETGLIDRRQDGNGHTKADDDFPAALAEVLRDTPPRFGHRRPTWTLRLLCQTLASITGALRNAGLQEGTERTEEATG